MSDGLAFKSFVSETELNEKRQKRQEEWEKVRTADQPEECPEEEYDNRSLYDRLQEQKDRKQAEYDDQHQFKNMVRGLDDDESKFLDEVAVRQMEIDMQKKKEEKEIMQEVEEYKNRVLSVEDSSLSASSSSTGTTTSTKEQKKSPSESGISKKKSQASLLAGAVKRKKSDSADESASKKTKVDTDSAAANNTSNSAPQSTSPSTIQTPAVRNGTAQQVSEVGGERSEVKRAQVVAVLPGLGHYANSDDSDTSESDGDSELDLMRPLVARVSIVKKKAISH
ncbi:LOW QUALITY PROTEIN: uncharacterized protein [Amphiura filiformis]|uniref:LOW QUALITY PROTEIN: uncharacterized protein n=1 Tax=Amphiura filiformis TaxID=82378 RepID=UPI003B216EEC